MISTLFTKVHSRVLDAAPICIRAWYAARSLDRTGEGRVAFRLTELATALNVSIPTLKRYLKQAHNQGYFRSLHKVGGEIEVWYASLFDVALRLGLRELGAVTELNVADLNRSYIRVVATQLDAERCQRSSMHLAKKSVPNSQRGRIFNPKDILEPRKTLSHCSRGATVLFIGKRCVFVNDDVIPVGVSQKKLAELSERSISTIQRRLSNQHRRKRNLPTVLKRQVVQKVNNDAIAFGIKELGASTIVDPSTGRSYFVQSGSVWRSGCNIYRTEFELKSVRFLRSRFKYEIAAIEYSLRGIETDLEMQENLMNLNTN
jgi:transcriptional regulator with XRE-family HTH domain